MPDDSLSGTEWYRDILLKFYRTILMIDEERKQNEIEIMKWLDTINIE